MLLLLLPLPSSACSVPRFLLGKLVLSVDVVQGLSFNNNERGLSWLLQIELNISRAWVSPHFWHKLYTDSRITHWTQIRLPSSLLKQVCPEEGYQWPPCCKVPWQFSALILHNLSIAFAAIFHHPSWVSWDIFFLNFACKILYFPVFLSHSIGHSFSLLYRFLISLLTSCWSLPEFSS